MKRINVRRSRYLRQHQTEAERKLWKVLRNRAFEGIKFRRQFALGTYILDFYCPAYKLAIEADGGQHFDDANSKRDESRTKELQESGIRLIRFSNTDILRNIEGVYEAIQKAIENTPHPSTSPQRGEEGKA